MKKLLLSVAATAMLATGAMAADPVAPVSPTYSSSAFDWDGFYMGLGVTGGSFTGFTLGMVDVIAGFNATSGDVLFGAELGLGLWQDSSPTSGVDLSFEGRLGYLVAPEALIYLAAGGVYVTDGVSSATYGTVGGGIEFAVSNDLTLDLEYKYWFDSGAVTTGSTVGASANWHF